MNNLNLYFAKDIGQFRCCGDRYFEEFKASLNKKRLDGSPMIYYDDLDTAINQYELALERATKIEWLDEINSIKGQLSILMQYKKDYPKPEDANYYNLEIGDLSCTICGKDHEGDCK